VTEPTPNYDTATPPPRYGRATLAFGTLTLEAVAERFVAYADSRRRALLQELKQLEEGWLGYGRNSKPTTKRLRELWRKWGGRCPHCGKELK